MKRIRTSGRPLEQPGAAGRETNAAREFAIGVVTTGEMFTVYARKKDKFVEPSDRTPRFTVKAGEEKDLGTVTVKE